MQRKLRVITFSLHITRYGFVSPAKVWILRIKHPADTLAVSVSQQAPPRPPPLRRTLQRTTHGALSFHLHHWDG